MLWFSLVSGHLTQIKTLTADLYLEGRKKMKVTWPVYPTLKKIMSILYSYFSNFYLTLLSVLESHSECHIPLNGNVFLDFSWL